MLLQPSKLKIYLSLMRADRPIGFYLVLWPALWALFFAGEGDLPPVKLLVIFTIGAFLMRSAGCVINDYADRHWDGNVTRTRERPLVTKAVSEREALVLFVLLCFCAAALLIFLHAETRIWSIGALFLATAYPFTKRFSHFPQLVLGAAFAWAIPMAYVEYTGGTNVASWVLYIAVLVWVVVYDTFYAMVDRRDDLKTGIKSTAIFFGHFDRSVTAALQLLFIMLMIVAGQINSHGVYYYLSLAIALGLFGYQQYLIKDREADRCFRAFLNNNYVGWSIFLGLLVQAGAS